MKISQRTAANGEDELPETLHPVLRRVYLARGVTTAEGLGLGLEQLLPAAGLKGIEAAVALLESVLEAQGRILVVGDYDADGATSTALALLALQAFGCEKVGYLVPNRFEFGYGLSPEIVELAARQQPDLIITVDNGIASISGVSRAAELGIPVLVTDHHLPGEQLPAAAAIVNPNQPGDGFASKNLAGVGVIFYLLVALRARLRQAGWFERCGLAVPNMAEWLDLVVLGTVADLVVLDQNNRILVEQGLRRIRAGRCRPGIEALIRLAGRDQSRLVASDLGYAIGPRLNAAGRLEDMGLGIECLLADDPSAALQMAVELDRLNRTRREIEQQMQEQAQQLLQQLHREMQGEIPLALCLYDPNWHQGVVGILASRIKEKYHRPVIAFADGGDGILKGSARSVPALHIRDLLERIASRHAGLIERFGGHAMAAGLSLPKQNLERFRQAFEAEAANWLDPAELVGELLSDGELEAEALGLELAQLLRQAGPWGQGFPAPLFDGRFQVLQQRVVGERHLKLRLRTEQGDAELDGIAFNQAEMGELASQVRLAYRLDVNEFRGQSAASACGGVYSINDLDDDATEAAAEEELPSKSQVKRELLALQQLGERLTRLSPEILRRMPLNNELQAALEEAKRIRSHGALRRHYRRLGKLLRHAEMDAIQRVLDEVDNKHSGEVNRFHALERWRERLIEGDSQVFGSFFAEYPGADRQRLRQLIQAARKEREAEKPPLAYRKLFKCLREIAGL